MPSYNSVDHWDFSWGLHTAKLEGFSEEAYEQLVELWNKERDEELSRRLKILKPSLRERVLWDAAIEHFISGRLPSVNPYEGYFLLPLEVEEGNEDLRNTLILPPHSIPAVEIPWQWTALLYNWIMMPIAGRGVGWIRMMMEEHGLADADASNPWKANNGFGHKFDPCERALLGRELLNARKIEATKRITGMWPWLLEMDIAKRISYSNFWVISPRNYWQDPEDSYFAIEIVGKGNHVLIAPPGPRLPVLVEYDYQKLRTLTRDHSHSTQLALIEYFLDS